MHDALSVPRVHPPGSLTGYLDMENFACVIDEPKGQNIHTVGTNDSQGRLHLLPEECLYLLERGSLDLRYRDEDLEGIPLSLQAAYAYLIGNRELTLERYIVYALLRRSGYIVRRAPTWYAKDHTKVIRAEPPPAPPPPASTIMQRLFASLAPSTVVLEPLPSGPLVRPGLYRSYAPIYAQLALIPFHNPTLPQPCPSFEDHYPPLRLAYHVWKPTGSFRKTAPPSPDYRVCVADAKEDAFPTLEQLDDLLQCMPYEPPLPGHTYPRLRHGYRNVIMAVVDQGIASFVRIGDAAFGCEPVWNRTTRGGKGGGRGRGRGRERGRGRGR